MMDDTLLDAHDLEQRNLTTFITCLKRLIDDSYTTSTDLQSLHAQKQAVLHRAHTVFQHKCASTWPQQSPPITIITPPQLEYHSKPSKWLLSLQIEFQIQSPSASIYTPSHFALLATSPHCHIHTSPLPLPPLPSISNINQPITLTSLLHITPDNIIHNDNNNGLIHMEVFILCVHLSSKRGRNNDLLYNNTNTNTISCPLHAGSVRLSWKEWIKSMASDSGSEGTVSQCIAKYMVVVTNNADETTTAIQHSLINVLVNDLNFTLSSTTTNEQQCYVLGAGVSTATVMIYQQDNSDGEEEIGDMAALVIEDTPHGKHQQHGTQGKKYGVLKLEANSDEVMDVIRSEVDRALLLVTSKEGKNWSWEDEMPKYSGGGRHTTDALLKESECIVKWIEGMLQRQAVIAAADDDGNGGLLPGQLKDVVGLEALQNDVIKAMMATNTAFQ